MSSDDPEVTHLGEFDPRVLLAAVQAELDADPDNVDLIGLALWLRMCVFRDHMRTIRHRQLALDTEQRQN